MPMNRMRGLSIAVALLLCATAAVPAQAAMRPAAPVTTSRVAAMKERVGRAVEKAKPIAKETGKAIAYGTAFATVMSLGTFSSFVSVPFYEALGRAMTHGSQIGG